MRRRDFLSLAAATAGLGLLRPPLLAAPWGSAPDPTAAGLLLPPGVRAEKVLELFLYGGLAPFESFYVVDAYGRPDDPTYPNTQWYLFQSQHDKIFGRCGVDDPPLLEPFALDSLGMQVNLGPLVMPLRKRPDILARLRILVMHHELQPHEAAIPLALSGQRLGSPRMAGLGAAVQRTFMDRDTSGRRIPYSYVLYPDNEISTDNLRAASAVGFHPGSARPLDLRIASDSNLQEWLSRSNLGSRREAFDALVAHYAALDRARYSLGQQTLRSRALDDQRFALQTLQNSDDLQALFPPEVMMSLSSSQCNEGAEDTTAMGLTLATHLLTHPTTPARHVTVVDGGLIPASGGGGYDTHSRHLPDQARNMLSMLTNLVARINEPGEQDPAKLNLDDTMVVLNTEFGRTPYAQARTLGGTNHHPYGYVIALIGGPIRAEQAGILGAIGPDGWSDHYLTPVEARAAILAAMGIYPFAQEAFTIGDLRGQSLEKDGLYWLNEVVLGQKEG